MLSDTPAGKIGRTIHLGMDIFSANLEPVYAPCAGKIVRSGYERGFGEYGNYLILQPKQADYYLFFGHLANNRLGIGPVDNGQVIGHLGDYEDNENGGWSRHLHIQILKQLPPTNETPIGYSTMNDFVTNHNLFPDPLDYFPEWQLQ
jgi:murein DD-endopeptidase MepM/ murein hydrolase activator NlpD